LAITSGYVRLNSDGRPEGVYHTQIDCNSCRTDHNLELMNLTETEGKLHTSWRGKRIMVRACTKCGPELQWDWQEDAKCRGIGMVVDMIDIGRGKYYEARRLIAEYCDNCAVIRDCAEFALARPKETFGIWGGVLVGIQNHTEGIQALTVKHAILSDSDAA
jgi:hypothetical protein